MPVVKVRERPTTVARDVTRSANEQTDSAEIDGQEQVQASHKQSKKRLRIRLSRRELSQITSQLAIMVRSGVDLASALETLRSQARRKGPRGMLGYLHDQVLGGSSFSGALREYEEVVGGAYTASVAAGEAAGKLPDVLAHLAKALRSELRLRATIRAMMAYPVVLTTVSLAVTTALLVFVLPQFAKIYDQYGMPLPAITTILLAAGVHVRSHILPWGCVAAAIIALPVLTMRSRRGREFVDRVFVYAILLRNFSRDLFMGRACRMLGLMLESGVPLLEALHYVQRSMKNSLYNRLFQKLRDEVLTGQGIGAVLIASDIVPDATAEMLATGERTGNLEAVSTMLGEHLEEEAETRLRELITFIEPAITIVLGVIVAIVVLSVMLPMLDLTKLSQGG